MVSNTLNTLAKVEHEIENSVKEATDSNQDSTQKELEKMQREAERLALNTLRELENWGRHSSQKINNTEEIIR